MPKLIDHDARERAIGDAAWRLIAREGLHGLSVRKVAAESGIAVASLRHSFPTQAALHAYCLVLAQDRATARIQALDPTMPIPQFVRAALFQLLPLDEERALELEVQVTLWSLSRTDPAIAQAYRAADAAIEQLCLRLVTLMDDAGRAGTAPGPDLAAQALDLHTLIDGLAIKLLWGPPVTFEAATAIAAASIDRHLARAAR
jgi:AcrR family transcriptional regulator